MILRADGWYWYKTWIQLQNEKSETTCPVVSLFSSLLRDIMMDGIPIADSDACNRLATPNHKRCQGTIAVNVCSFQVVTWRPGIGVIGTIRKQDAKGHVVFRDGKLGDLVCAHLLKIQRHGWIELAWVADIARDSTMW